MTSLRRMWILRSLNSFRDRLRAQRPAKRLNLPKKFAASTLANFQSEYTTRNACSPRGRP